MVNSTLWLQSDHVALESWQNAMILLVLLLQYSTVLLSGRVDHVGNPTLLNLRIEVSLAHRHPMDAYITGRPSFTELSSGLEQTGRVKSTS